jgi:hypothetical protein
MHRLIPNVHGYWRNQTALSYEHRQSVHHSGLAMDWQVYSAQDIPELLFKDSGLQCELRQDPKLSTRELLCPIPFIPDR